MRVGRTAYAQRTASQIREEMDAEAAPVAFKTGLPLLGTRTAALFHSIGQSRVVLHVFPMHYADRGAPAAHAPASNRGSE